MLDSAQLEQDEEMHNYYDLIHSARFYFPVITALFFVIKLIGGRSEDRIHSLLLCILCCLYFITPDIKDGLSEVAHKAAFIEGLWIEILISGAGMLAMFFFTIRDSKAFPHAVLLAFIIFINFMLTWHYTVNPSPFFYEYFDELIITASVLQIMVSHNGIIESISRIIGFFRSLQGSIGWAFFSCLCLLGNIQEHFKSEKRT